MRQLTELTDDYKQKFDVVLENGETVEMIFEYVEQQQHWLLSLTYQSFSFKNMRLCYDLNMLRKYKNIIPFGLAVSTEDGGDPYFLDDFVNGRVEVDILNELDVKAVEDEFFI